MIWGKAIKPKRRKRGETQTAILEFIKAYKQENNGNSPSYEEIAQAIGISKQAAYQTVTMLAVRHLDLISFDTRGRIVYCRGEFILENG